MNKSLKVSHFWLTKAATYKTPAFHDKSFYVKKLILEQVWTFVHRTTQLLRCVWANNWIYQGKRKRMHLGHLKKLELCAGWEVYHRGGQQFSALASPSHKMKKAAKDRDCKTEQGKELPTELSVQLAYLANGKCSF